MKQGILLICGVSGLLLAHPGYGQQLPAPGVVPRAQGLVLTGTVRDAQGQPLELVVVSIAGQPGGATTTADGSFTLRLTLPVRPDAPAGAASGAASATRPCARRCTCRPMPPGPCAWPCKPKR